MSPGVTNFVHDLVAMAQAMDELPRVKEALEAATADIEDQRITIQKRELTILDLKAEIETLTASKNKEADRADNAEFRFLELSEAFGPVASAAGTLLAGVGAVNAIINPPKPIPTVVENGVMVQSPAMGELEHPVTEHEPFPSTGQSADPLLTSGASDTGSGPEHVAPAQTMDTAGATHTAEAPSSPLPPDATLASPSPIASQPAQSTESASDGGGSGGKYSGRKWSSLSPEERGAFWNNYHGSGIAGTRQYWEHEGGTHDNFYA